MDLIDPIDPIDLRDLIDKIYQIDLIDLIDRINLLELDLVDLLDLIDMIDIIDRKDLDLVDLIDPIDPRDLRDLIDQVDHIDLRDLLDLIDLIDLDRSRRWPQDGHKLTSRREATTKERQQRFALHVLPSWAAALRSNPKSAHEGVALDVLPRYRRYRATLGGSSPFPPSPSPDAVRQPRPNVQSPQDGS